MVAYPYRSALVAVCVLAFAAPAASARTLRDAVRVAVVQAYAGSGAVVSNFVFGDMRLMSLTRDDVCGSVKFEDGAGTDFFYSEGDVLLDTERHETVEEHCRKISRTRLAAKGRPWTLECVDAAPASPRVCVLTTALPAGDSVYVTVGKADDTELAPMLVLEPKTPDGRFVTLTIAGEATKCPLVPFPSKERGWYYPCDDATSQRLAQALGDGKSISIELGGQATDLVSDGFDRLFSEARRYFLTFRGGAVKIPETH